MNAEFGVVIKVMLNQHTRGGAMNRNEQVTIITLREDYALETKIMLPLITCLSSQFWTIFV